MLKSIYGLQGGGLGIMENNELIFIEIPTWANKTILVGDAVPKDWSYVLTPNLMYDTDTNEIFE